LIKSLLLVKSLLTTHKRALNRKIPESERKHGDLPVFFVFRNICDSLGGLKLPEGVPQFEIWKSL
jgi:hypothetical protein